MPYDVSSGFTDVPGFTKGLTVYHCDAREAETDDNYWGGVPVGYTQYYSGRPLIPWKWLEAAEFEGHISTDWEPYILATDSPEYRENDPLQTNWLAASRPLKETVLAMEPVAQLAKQNGAKIGTYDLATLVYRNINAVRNLTTNSFSTWARVQEKYMKMPVSNGLSIIDVINSFGGKFYFTAYVSDPGFDANGSSRTAFRRYIKRLISFYDGLGADSVPLFTPYVSDHFVSDSLLLGMRDDVQAYQPGEWGVWSAPEFVNQTQWNTFTNKLVS